jgi:transcriptional regulator
MYTPTHFQEDRPELQHGLIRDYPLGTLIVSGPDGITVDLLPFMLYPGEGERGMLRAHVARANPVWKTLREQGACLVVFQGPDGYVSPNWYATKAETHKVVPTWNYAMVQVRGTARVVENALWLRRLLDDLTAMHEARLPQPWKPADAPADFLAAMMQGIVGIELPIAAIAGKWKVSQNRSVADREGVIAGLAAQPVAPSGGAVMAALVAATLAAALKPD